LIKLSKNSTTVTFEPGGGPYHRCGGQTATGASMDHGSKGFCHSLLFNYQRSLPTDKHQVYPMPALPIREWKTFNALKDFPFANLRGDRYLWWR